MATNERSVAYNPHLTVTNGACPPVSNSDQYYHELAQLRESVRKLIKAYDYGMNKLWGWAGSAAESYEPIVGPYVDELRGLVGKEEA